MAITLFNVFRNDVFGNSGSCWLIYVKALDIYDIFSCLFYVATGISLLKYYFIMLSPNTSMTAFFRNNKSLIRKNFFPFQSVKKTVIISAVIIISISFILFFYFQQQTEQSIKDTILAQQIQNQKDSTRSLAQHIQSDLNLIMAKLQGLALSSYVQRQDFQSSDAKSLMQNYYHQINSSSPVDRLFVVNDKGIAQIDLVPKGQHSYVGMNFSYREWIKKTKDTLQPQFSSGFAGKDGKYRVAITYPIILKNTVLDIQIMQAWLEW